MERIKPSVQWALRGFFRYWHIIRALWRALQLVEARDADEDDPAVRPSHNFRTALDPAAQPFSIKICDLFDFESSDWLSTVADYAGYGLEDELELFELLDFDAAGEVVPEDEAAGVDLGDGGIDLDEVAYDVMGA
ncbi:hypothetical protein ACG7TL_004967 [Trametes sanguinea]